MNYELTITAFAATAEEKKSRPLAPLNRKKKPNHEIQVARFLDQEEIQEAIRETVRLQMGLGHLPLKESLRGHVNHPRPSFD